MSGNYHELIAMIQQKINNVLQQGPKLFARLEIIFKEEEIWRILNIEPRCSKLVEILSGRVPQSLQDPGYAFLPEINPIHLVFKRNEYKALLEEVYQLFNRLSKVLTYMTLLDLCKGEGRIIVLPEGEHSRITLFNYYSKRKNKEDYEEVLQADERIEAARVATLYPFGRSSESSSDDSIY